MSVAPSAAWSAEALIAVASNFKTTAQRLSIAFEKRFPDHSVKLTNGSTGKLYAQIVNGAPFDAVLAADLDRPRRLESNGRAVPGSRFTYAKGRLVLLIKKGSADTEKSNFAGKRIALAQPDLAPYGFAAKQVLDALPEAERPTRLVYGANIGQAFAMTVSGAVDAGFVAASQIRTVVPQSISRFTAIFIESKRHAPILQQAVLLRRGVDNEAAKAFLAFLKEAEALAIIEADGYLLPEAQAREPK